MMGMTADFPVRDAPLIIVTLPGANFTRRTAFAEFRGHRMISLIWKNMSEPQLERCCNFVKRERGAPRAKLFRVTHQLLRFG